MLHNIGTKHRIAEAIGLKEKNNHITLVRLVPEEYDRVLKLSFGNKVAIVNLQHYQVDENAQEFQINSRHFGVCIKENGIHTAEKQTEPKLDESRLVVTLRLQNYLLNVPSTYTPIAADLDVDQVILAGASTVSEHLSKKYHGVMNVAADAKYYIRAYTITGILSPLDQKPTVG